MKSQNVSYPAQLPMRTKRPPSRAIEKDVRALLAVNPLMTSYQIALSLHISDATAKRHRERILAEAAHRQQ